MALDGTIKQATIIQEPGHGARKNDAAASNREAEKKAQNKEGADT